MKPDGNSPLGSVTVRWRRGAAKGGKQPAAVVGEAVSDERGLVVLSMSDVGERETSVALELEAEGLTPARQFFPLRRGVLAGVPPTVTLRPATSVELRVFDPEGKPAAGATVTLDVDLTESPWETWRYAKKADSEGKFRCNVPTGGAVGIMVTADNAAPSRIVYPPGAPSYQDVRLTRGARLKGVLLDVAGRPVPGCRLVLEAEDSQSQWCEYQVKSGGGTGLRVAFVRPTDAEGRYEFPPLSGPARVFVEPNGESGRYASQFVPEVFELPSGGETWRPLRLSPAGRVAGTVRWPDGKPVSNVEVSVEVVPHRGGSYLRLGATSTDAAGRYEVEVPYPSENMMLFCHRVVSREGAAWSPRSVPVRGGESSRRDAPLGRYAGEPRRIDWEMMPADAPFPKGEPTVDEAWRPLADFEAEMRLAYARYEAAESEDDKRRLEPRPTLLKRAFELEAAHRGSRVAIGALQFVMRSGSAGSGVETSAARTEACARLQAHYLAHADADLLIDGLSSGVPASNALELLEAMALESPYDYVRAAALLAYARECLHLRHLKEQIYAGPPQTEEELEQIVAVQSSEATRRFLRGRHEEEKLVRSLLTKHDALDFSEAANAALDSVITRYQGVAAPRRSWNTVAADRGEVAQLKLAEDVGSNTWRRRTAAEQAAALVFQQNRLQVGQEAPRLEGRDYYHRPISLEQFRGRVVLLTVSHSPLERELYGACAEAVRSLKGEPFACVSVVSSGANGGYSFREAVGQGKINWPVIRDSFDDDIAWLWCQETTPEYYVIDARGIIRHHAYGQASAAALLHRVREQLDK